MVERIDLPVGIELWCDIECRPGATGDGYRARVRWRDPQTGKRPSKSETFKTLPEAEAWIDRLKAKAAIGVSPVTLTSTLEVYGESVMDLAMRGLERKTLDPYMSGWRKRVVPTVGHLAVPMITNGVVDRAVNGWIADECGRSTVKNTLAVWARVMEQAKRDELVDRNPVEVKGWQKQYQLVEDELDDPRSMALADYAALSRLADALVERSAGRFAGWGKVVKFMGCTAARIGEASGCRVRDIDTKTWMWLVRRQTTTTSGGLVDKNTKGKRARLVPLIEEVRPLVLEQIDRVDQDPDARLFTGPRGGRITTAVLRDATHWDDVVAKQGYEHLRRHDLRHTGLTWMANAGIPVHVLRLIAGHGSLDTTQRYLHPNHDQFTDAGNLLSAYLQRTEQVGLKVVS
ncbi:site-specific integrase [Actinokineospora terrae]|uniref:Phage integrase family protein n=1 Tax=Actinokineospora terrae TaxID=155974 RepID=A0A1H9X325_9PSEU|nr:site-specific integrase [Actinokineospora terrae]SES40287.1 Phage integrase family protein [Actinokineospora terrae]